MVKKNNPKKIEIRFHHNGKRKAEDRKDSPIKINGSVWTIDILITPWTGKG